MNRPHESLLSFGPSTLSPERLGEVARALDRETQIVRRLRDTLVQQRAGVAGSQAEEVNATVDSIGRILLALGEAHAYRNGVLDTLTGERGLTLDELERVLGGPLPEGLTEARTRLKAAAEEVAREVAINRTVLRRAVEAGEAFLQALFSAATVAPAVYGNAERTEEAPTGMLLNRRA
jgi:hypothetical protein